MRRRFLSTCIASRRGRARGCRRRSWGWRRKCPRLEDQKIAAFGSSYRGTHSNVGAAEGCDLLISNQNPRIPLSTVFASLPHDGRITTLGLAPSA
ncbi:hypothetical protein F7R05_18860 [Pseudomonas koreensis]|nr:hypothetical protein F7R05_18860 [Pseudomonas koreensis]